jgi:hypothetical protein
MIDYLPVFVSVLLLLLVIPTFATLTDSRGRKAATRFGYASVCIALLILVVVALLIGENLKGFLLQWSIPFVLFFMFLTNSFGTPGLRRRDTGRRRL